MTVALSTVLKHWAIPRMGVRCIHLDVLIENEGSLGVFKKNGFNIVQTVENCMELRGVKRGIHVLEWKVNDS